jgi:hypothetical protein
MIYGMPNLFMSELNGVEMIIGKPLLMNYYTIFNVEN